MVPNISIEIPKMNTRKVKAIKDDLFIFVCTYAI